MLNIEQISFMLKNSKLISQQAYSGMKYQDHKWNKFTSKEIEYIILWYKMLSETSFIETNKIINVLDIGCGTGRHSIELAYKDPLKFNIKGIDINENLINIANKNNKENTNPKFICADARRVNLSETYDIILCLYDVIGSYTEFEFDSDFDQNQELLNNISLHLNVLGVAFISVMSYEYTKNISKYFYKSDEDLVNLPVSSIQEISGNVFDPNFFMLDNETGIVYRKEKINDEILLVKDKRFSIVEFYNMLKIAGLEIYSAKTVKAGNWNEDLGEINGKELLFVVTKKK